MERARERERNRQIVKREREREKLERRLSLEGEYREKRESPSFSTSNGEVVCGCEGEDGGVESPDQLDEMKREIR